MRCAARASLVAAAISLSTGAALAAPPDQEVIPLAEKPTTLVLSEMIKLGVKSLYTSGKQRPSRRDAHNKGHGCVKADFTVLPNIPEKLRVGVFAQPKTWKAWIRYSNSSNHRQNDHEGDGRGMAIKLMGVPGKKVLSEEADAKTQDFLMISLPTFFIPNVTDYLEFVIALQRGKEAEFFKARPIEGATQKAMNDVYVGDELATKFYSMSPYLLGDSYIKFAALPIDCATGAKINDQPPKPAADDPDFLRERMVKDLHEKDACFVFAVQPQTDPKTQPIENPTVLWKESEAPFVDVARITIPKQTFDTPAQQTFCENLSYTPWHTLPEERPVGGINRMRRAVYEAVSSTRHELNQAPRVEPTGDEHFN